MLIQGTSISLTYRRINSLKKAYYNNEDILKEFFNEAAVLPVPDDAPDEIPRIIIKTLHEHAQLNITPVAATLQILYNDGYENCWEKCASYIRERMGTVFGFLNLLTNNKYDYIGIVTNILMDDVAEDGAKVLANNLLKVKDVSRIYDLNVKYTFVEDDEIFVNITLQNARLFRDGISADTAGSLGIKNQIAESIGAVVDINDRYGFNSSEEYHTSSKQLDILLQRMSEVIGGKLEVLLQKGVYECNRQM